MGKRTYAALPHEYLEEMADLSDEEFGRLCRELLRYSATGERGELPGNERFCIRRVLAHENRHQESYRQLCLDRSAAGKKGAEARWGKTANDGKSGNNKNKTKNETKNKNKNKNYSPPYTRAETDGPDERLRRDLEWLAQFSKEEKDI